MARAELDLLATRLQADLRVRFAEIAVTFVQDVEGTWVCRVEDGPYLWGEAPTLLDEDAEQGTEGDELTPNDAERLLVEVAIEVVDNLWPDDLTDPWPLCPHHGSHPLQVRLAGGGAAWVCLQDAVVLVPVGSLAGSFLNDRLPR